MDMRGGISTVCHMTGPGQFQLLDLLALSFLLGMHGPDEKVPTIIAA